MQTVREEFTNYVEAISVNVLLTSRSFVAASLQIYFNNQFSFVMETNRAKLIMFQLLSLSSVSINRSPTTLKRLGHA